MVDFYTDEDVSLYLLPLLAAFGHDVLAATRTTPPHTPDHEQLATAVRLQRTLLTHNASDFLALHRAWRDWFAERGPPSPPRHPGILAVPQPPLLSTGNPAELIARFVSGFPSDATLTGRFMRWSVTRGWEEIT
jgi:hypothetical protein